MADICVIGAGVAGLYAALRARQAGHTVTVLEAKPRAGGLSTTVRDGDVLAEYGPDGALIHQTAALAPGLYVNAGPGRIPHHHRRVLGLCSQLGVALEPYIMTSDANYYVDHQTGVRWQRRRVEHDARGHVAALAYSPEDPPHLQELVTAFGDLRDGAYTGSQRAGPGAVVPLRVLARSGFWRHRFWQPLAYLWQAAMFQPRGGMDQLWRAMLTAMDAPVVYNAPVVRVRTGGRRVRVWWRHGGAAQQGTFDWCLSAVPLPLLDGEVHTQGFSADFEQAMGTPGFAEACKVGWQAQRRWWQDDHEQIYGGISYTNHAIQQFWYPSSDFTCPQATLTGAYAAYAAAAHLGGLPLRERLAAARRGGAAIHPEVADTELVSDANAVTVAWHRVPHQAGGWCHWNPDNPAHASAFRRLQAPDGRFCVIGDQVSSWPGWQEGCLESVERALEVIAGRAPRISAQVPDAQWLTEGDHPWGAAAMVV